MSDIAFLYDAQVSRWFFIAVAVLSRLASAVTVSTLPVFPGVSFRIRLATAVALTAVALPNASDMQQGNISSLPLLVMTEVVLGGILGIGVAMVLAAAGWSGTMLGSVSGVSWAQDFDPGSQEATAGIGRLAWWVGLAAFLSAGGQLVVITGMLDSFERLPVGVVLSNGYFDRQCIAVATEAPALALRIALQLALPVMATVVAFHLASAICLRVVPFAHGMGLLQGLATVVLLFAFWFGLDAWAAQNAAFTRSAVEQLSKVGPT